MKTRHMFVSAILTGVLACTCVAESEEGFVSLFNGKDLSGWTGAVARFTVQDGVLVYPQGGGKDGNIYTEKEYDNFAFRFEFRLTPAANSGIGIRTPASGNAALVGYEIQILDDTAEIFKTRKKLKPYQYHGSIYMIAPAKRGYLKPVGEWNYEEIMADGDRITVNLNGTTTVDHFDVSSYDRPTKGRIALLGHHSQVDFRNIRVKSLPPRVPAQKTATVDNVPPKGFAALFDGKTLEGWKGLLAQPYDKPHMRSKLTEEELAKLQAKADRKTKTQCRVDGGAIVFDGQEAGLCTAKEYGDFELYVDWKIAEEGDGGICLRGSPQVRICDRPEGSGSFSDDKKAGNKPLVVADNPAGQWNTFVITMKGDIVSVTLNGKLVVDKAPLENLWESGRPIPAKGQIELHARGSLLWFKNIYIRELNQPETNTTVERQ